MNKNETKSNWKCVADYMKNNKKRITFGKYISYWINNSPRRFLHYLSYYKFAAKMIGQNKKVLDIGCNEGIGTWLIANMCGYAEGIDFDKEAIESAKSNFQDFKNINFFYEDFFKFNEINSFDSIISFDVIEHILSENSDLFFSKVASLLTNNGMAIIGSPSEISQVYASEITKKGHVNIYSYEKLKNQMYKFFDYVFIFSVNDEVIHTGFSPLAHYFIAIGCK
jgi:2-polyprenyl-3-methyl-5-hydroxy-6-metoxy-1,4-benzoquinol methylase